MRFNKSFGFTLAEVMIVMVVIGVLAGVLVPVANNARPDQNVMKFKKAHATLANVVRELVISDRYYSESSTTAGAILNTNKNGSGVANNKFCLSLADVLSTKYVNCSSATNNMANADGTNANVKTTIDSWCKTAQSKYSYPEIVTSDGVVWYSADPNDKFNPGADGNGFFKYYKVMCFDVDAKLKSNYQVNTWGPEDPFGVGVRVDGKILSGARADAWLEKEFQKKKTDN